MTRRTLIALAAAGCLAPLVLAGTAHAGGLSVPRVGGLNYSSPVEGHPSAFWWNPAALGTMKGLHIGLDVAATFANGTYERTIDPLGDPVPDSTRYGVLSFKAFSPAPLVGISYGLERLTFGVGLFVPFGRGIDYAGTEEAGGEEPLLITDSLSPGRFHLIRTDLRHWYLTPGVSVEVIRETLWVGATFNIIYSTFLSWLTTDRNSMGEAIGDQAISRLGTVCAGTLDDVGICTASPDGTLAKDKPLSAIDFGFTAGLLLQPTEAAKLGVSLSSGSKVHFEGRGLFTTPDFAMSNHYESDVDLTYKLPWTFNIGAQYKLKRKLEIDLWYTFQNYQMHEDFLICVGTADQTVEKRTTGAIERCAEDAADNDPIAFSTLNKATVRYRGYKASHSVALGVAYPVIDKMLKVGVNVMYENSAVPKSAVTTSSLDSKKLDFLVAVTFSPASWLDINVGGSYIFAFPLDNTGEGDFRRTFDSCDPKAGRDGDPICGTEEFGPGDGRFKFSIWRVGIGLTLKLFEPKVKKAEFFIPPVTGGPTSGPASGPVMTPVTETAPSTAPAPAPAPAPGT